MWALAQLMKFLTPSTVNMRAPQASAAQSNYSTILKGDWDWDIKENKVFQVTNETSHCDGLIDARHTYNTTGLVVANSALLGTMDTFCESKSPLWWSPHADDSLTVTADAVPGLDLSFLDEESRGPGPIEKMLEVRIERRSPEQRKKTGVIIHTQEPNNDNSLFWEPSPSSRITSSPQTTASSTRRYHDGYSPSLADCGSQWYRENWSAECFPASRVVGAMAPSSHMSVALVPIDLGIMNLGGEEASQSPRDVAIDGAPVRTSRVRSSSYSKSSSTSIATPPPGLSSRHKALLDGCCSSTKTRPSTYGLTVAEICRQIESGEYFLGRMNASSYYS